MTQLIDSKDYQHGQGEAIGVLLVNLGTPTAPTTAALRSYLRQFLSDRRVIEAPRLLWWFILNFIILPRRSSRSAAAYKQVWTRQGSPLLIYSHAQQHKLAQQFKSEAVPINVELGMSYGNPSIPQALQSLKKAGTTHLLVLPLYPQYSSTTVGSAFETITHTLCQWRWVPHLRMIQSYHDEPLFIKTLASTIEHYQNSHGSPQQLIFSFHGIPLAGLLDGDPYHCQCHKTARLVVEELGLAKHEYRVCFQSRFGRQEWLQPYTDKTIEALAVQGVKNIQVVCPGFSSDCLETLEEIDEENHQLFLQAGGETFGYIPCLNDSKEHIDFLTYLIKQNISDWLTSRQTHHSQRQQTKQLAADLHEKEITDARSYQYS